MNKMINLAVSLILSTHSLYAQEVAPNTQYLILLNDALTKTMVPDGVNPPLASRFYLYPNMAFNLVYHHLSGSVSPYSRVLSNQVVFPEAPKMINNEYCSFLVFEGVFSTICYRPEYFENLIAPHRPIESDELIRKNSEQYAKACIEAILGWMAKDNYSSMRTMPEYTTLDEEWSWEPTPPNYYDALEPNWHFMKSIVDYDTSGLVMNVPIKFDTSRTSQFYQQVMEVMTTVENITEDQFTIAKHWDCNPLQTHVDGHFMFDSKQMTPGGHWMGIAGIAIYQEALTVERASEVFCNVSIALYEGFIIAWRTKYKWNLIRPETYINRYIDPDWRPLLETPPFPEFTSAHSVISMASAIVLEHTFGASYSFLDTLEVQYRLPERTFPSFQDAAEEVSVSRVYGGIHYPMGVQYGMAQGNLIGDRLLKTLYEPK